MPFSPEYEQILKNQISDEISIETPTGLKIAAKVWGPSESENRVLAVHGWLDNANSFDLLAPYLAAHRLQVIAIDLIGHGKSIFKPLWADYSFLDYVTVIVDIIECLGWKKFTYLGHSMGAAIGSVLTAAMPEAVEKLIMIDTLGPWTRNISTVGYLSLALHERDKIVARKPLIYPTREEAFAKYRRNNPFISDRGAGLLLERGLLPVVSPVGKIGYRFRHDPRLVANSPVRFRDQEVIEILGAIQCPCILVIASSSALQYKDFNKPENVERFKKRVAAVKDLEVLEIQGSHHVHLDNPEALAQKFVDFVLRPTEEENPDVEKLKSETCGGGNSVKIGKDTKSQANIPLAKL